MWNKCKEATSNLVSMALALAMVWAVIGTHSPPLLAQSADLIPAFPAMSDRSIILTTGQSIGPLSLAFPPLETEGNLPHRSFERNVRTVPAFMTGMGYPDIPDRETTWLALDEDLGFFRGNTAPDDDGNLDESVPPFTVSQVVTDADGDMARVTFTFEVIDVVPIKPTVQNLEFDEDEAITAFPLPPFTTNVDDVEEIDAPELTYSLMNRPPGLNFTPSTRVLSGTPTASGTTTVTYRAHESSQENRDWEEVTFTITVIPDVPSFGDATIPNLSLAQNSAITNLTLPMAIGKDQPLRYNLTPALPQGLSFNTGSRVLSGTPMVNFPTQTFTYTVSDSDPGQTDTLMFTITTVAGDLMPVAPTTAIGPFTYAPAEEVSVTLPAFTSGNTPLTYTLTPTLPQGLSFDARQRLISGTIPADTVVGEIRDEPLTYTYTATDADGDATATTFAITVERDLFPSVPRDIVDYVFVPGMRLRVNDYVVPRFGSGNGTITYSLSNADGTPLPTEIVNGDTIFTLVAGLTFESWESSRNIRGTIPADTAGDTSIPAVTYIYTATDEDGDTRMTTFSIRVVDSIPVVPTTLQASYSLRANQPARIVLPAFTTTADGIAGVTAPTTHYNVTGLPSGLSFTPDTRTISGTPGAAGPAATIRYFAADFDSDDGSSGDTTQATFTIRVVDEAVPRFANTETIADVAATVGKAITTNPLPQLVAGTGSGTPTYSIVPALPAGLGFDSNTRLFTGAITGTPQDDTRTAEYTYRATDANSISTSLPFTLVITDTFPVAPGDGTFRNTLTVGSSTNIGLQEFEISDDSDASSLTFSIALDSDPETPISSIYGLTLRNEEFFFGFRGRLLGTSNDDATDIEIIITATDPDGDTASFFRRYRIVDEIPSFGTRTINDILAITGSTIDMMLPQPEAFGTGEDTDRRYRLMRSDDMSNMPSNCMIDRPPGGMIDLGMGLSFDIGTDERTISGTPTEEFATTEYTYTYRDFDCDAVHLTFTITVEDESQPVAPTIPNGGYEFVPGQAVSVTLPVFTGGNGNLTYSLTDGPPNGNNPVTSLLDGRLSYNPMTRVISDTIADDEEDSDDSVPAVTYTYTATDADGDMAMTTFTVEILDPRPLPPTTAPDESFTVDVALQDVFLPEFNYANVEGSDAPPLTYSITNIPAGLSLHPTTRALTGTPNDDTPRDNDTVVYTATDGTDSASVSFDISIVDDPMPIRPDISDLDFDYEPGDVVEVELPLFSGGNGALTHRLTDGTPTDTNDITDLVGGLTYDPETRTISGTVDGSSSDDDATATYTYSARDTDTDGMHDTTPLEITLTITDEPPVAPTEDQDFTFTSGKSLSETLLPFTGGTGGAENFRYAFGNTTLPEGLRFNSNSRVLTSNITDSSRDDNTRGTPPPYTYTATDTDGDVATATFTIAIIDELPEFAPGTTINDMTFRRGEAITPVVTLPAAIEGSGTGPTEYRLHHTDDVPDVSLPAGLRFNAVMRTLSGTPTETFATTGYTYRAVDDGGDFVPLTFNITVEDDSRPMAPPIPPYVFVPGQTVSETLPAFTGGNGEKTYRLTDGTNPVTSLLGGRLSYNQETRLISDTIAADVEDSNDSVPAVTYTYTATDEDNDTGTTTFTVEILDPRPLAPVVAASSYSRDVPLVDISLPPFGYANAPNLTTPSLTYSITNIPTGLSLHPSTRALTGTPDDTPRANNMVTYSATDGTDSASVSFDISIVDDPMPIRPAVSDFTFTPGQVVSEQLPLFTGGDGALTHRLTDGAPSSPPDTPNDVTSLAGGLVYEASSRTISGTVTATMGDDAVPATTYTYSARDTDIDGMHDTTSLTFTITIIDAMPLPPDSTPPLTFNVGDASTQPLLPFTSGTGGADMLTYALASTSTLPAGLSFEVSSAGIPQITGTFNGTLRDDTTDSPGSYSYTATDTDRDTASASFTIAITDALPVAPAAQPFTFAVGESVSRTLSAFTGGTGGAENLRYALATGTRLPSGLEFDANTRALTGIVGGTLRNDATDSPVSYTYTATDTDGDATSTTFTIAITDSLPNFGSRFIADIDGTQNSAITTTGTATVILNTGTGEVSYSFSPALPTGLTFDSDAFTISGTPIVAIPETTFTYIATDEDGDTASLMFMITVIEDMRPVVPTAEQIAAQDFVFEIGAAVSETLAPFTGGNTGENGNLTYALETTPALPSGLNFVTNTRALEGNLTADSSNDDKVVRTTYTYTATDADGDEESATFTIQITDTIPLAPRVNNQSYSVGMEITALTLPLFTTTTDRDTPNPNFTHTLTDGTNPISESNPLIANLMYDVGTRTISGTPNAEISATTYTYMATDDADSASLTFSITIAASDDPAPQAPTVNDLTYSPGDVVSVILDEFTGDDGPFMHRLTGTPQTDSNDVTSLVRGLMYEASSRTISGTVVSTGDDDSTPATTYTYSATDSDATDPDTTSVTFTITIEDALPVAPQIPATTFTIGQPLGEDALPPFTFAGDDTLTYSLADGTNPVNTLIGGLSFTPADRTITGSLAGSPNDDTVAATTYTYSAADADTTPDVTTTTFTIAIADEMPDISGGSIANIDILQNTRFSAVTLPASTTGTAPITYSLTAALPSGLNFDAVSRQISGVPVVAMPLTTYTYRATDKDGDTSDLMFTLRVEANTRPVAPASPQPIIIAVRDTINESLTRFTSGNGDLTYALATGTTLPLGLNFDAETPAAPAITGSISGTPNDDDVVATSYSYTATDSDGDNAAATFTIAITDAKPVPPASTPDFTFAVRETLSNRTLPAFTGGTGEITYSQVSPALPTGLSFNNAADSLALTGTVMGGATDDTDDPVPYSYSATDADGDVRSATFTIALTDLLPVAPTQPQPLTFTVGVAGSETLLAFDGGDRATSGGELTYALVTTPSLPAGLGFNVLTRVISGTIVDSEGDQNVVPTTYTYTAADADGDMAAAMFTIEVEDAVPVAPSPAIQNLVFDIGDPITTPVILREFTTTTAHNPSLTHSLSALPSGLSVASDNRTISGTPDALGSTTVTYSVTDGFDTAEVTFTIRVVNDPEPQAPAVSNLVYSPGDVANVILDEFTGGNGALTHRLTDGAPSDPSNTPNDVTSLVGGLTYDPQTRTIAGTVTSTGGDDSEAATVYTYSARDSDSTDPDTTTTTFTITITDAIPKVPVPAVSNLTFIPRESREVTLPPFTIDDDSTLTYQLALQSPQASPVTSLVGGRSFDPQTRIISGAVTGTSVDNSASATYTYSARDSDPTPDVASTTFTITINDVLPDLSGGSIADISATQNSPITAVTLPQTTGTGTVVYSLSPALPTGLTFRASTRMLFGTPTVGLTMTRFTYRATDADGDTDMLTFTITVEGDMTPAAPSDAQNFVFEPGDTVSEILAVFTSGDGDLTYALFTNPSLPVGLSFNAQTRVISGTLTADRPGDDSVARTTYTYTATDADGDTVPSTFTIQIVDAIPRAPAVSHQSFTVSVPISPVTLPEFANVNAHPEIDADTPTYSLTAQGGGALPNGLAFEPNTRVLSGTPDVLGSTTVTYRATDGVDSDQINFNITVSEDSMPQPPTIAAIVFTPGQVVSRRLPDFSGGDGVLNYSLTEGGNPVTILAAGLTYTPADRTISGTVPSSSRDDSVAARMYTYSATDSDAMDPDTAMTTFTIAVADAMPSFGSQTIPTISGTQDTAIAPATLPQVATAGTGETTYSVTPALPNGLRFTAIDRRVLGTPSVGVTNAPYTYTATDEDGDTNSLIFTITIVATRVTPLAAPTAVQTFSYDPGEEVNTRLAPFAGGSGSITYALTDAPGLMSRFGLRFIADSLMLTGTLPANGSGDDSVIATSFTYTATDDDTTLSATFTIAIEDNFLIAPDIEILDFTLNEDVGPDPLPAFGNATPSTIYTLEPLAPSTSLPPGLVFTGGRLTGSPSEVGETSVTYTATIGNDSASVDFTIRIVDIPSLNDATASALPSVGANIALVATQAISSRVELALDGLSSGIDIRTLEGTQFRLNPIESQQRSGSSRSAVRFGVWYSAASDSLSDTRSTVTWNGTTDSTNFGFDVSFDISVDASLVIGILQNSSATNATYSNTNAANSSSSTLSVDFDSTAFYVGLGYDWLDAWFANGSADSTLTDSMRQNVAIPVSFSYQTIGLTAAFEVIDSLSIGAKVESLTSDLSLTEMSSESFRGLQTDSSQLRTTFVANYQLELGENGNGLLVPKFEFGFRDLSLGSSISGPTTAVGGSAMETGFGIDYFQRAWGLTVGLDIRSISVENYSADSTQWQVRWESGDYSSGLSFQLAPHSASETLGGIDSLYSGDYNQYQSLLQRQHGGNNAADTKGMDLEVGYGIAAGYGTLTPYLKTSNYLGSGNRTEELGIRYQTLQGLELTLTASATLTPQVVTQQENTLTLSTRYSF